jgi:predicted dehydrogenase
VGGDTLRFGLIGTGRRGRNFIGAIERREMPEGLGENLAIELEFSGSVRAAIEIGNLFRQKRRSLRAEFGAHSLLLDDTGTDNLTRTSGSAISEPVAISDEPPLSCAVQAFADAVRTNSRDTAPLKFATRVVEVLEKCERALTG